MTDIISLKAPAKLNLNLYVKDKLTEHEKLLQLNPKFRVRTASESFSVSGSIRSNGINT